MEKRYYSRHVDHHYEIVDRSLIVATVDDPVYADRIVEGLNLVEQNKRFERQRRARAQARAAYPGFGGAVPE